MSTQNQAGVMERFGPGRPTVRSLVLGAAVTVLVNLMAPYSAYIVHSSRTVFSHLPMATLVVFTLLAWPLNVLLGRVRKSWALGRDEMAVVFCAGWIGATVPEANFIGLFIGGIAAPYYYASSENRWNDYVLDYLPRWAVPTNADGQMRWFFEGMPSGAGIPWSAWLWPLVWWGTFLAALVLASAALVSVMRRQWVERERLPFPNAEVALRMTEEAEAPGAIHLVRDRLFRIGASVPLSVMVWNIAGYFWHNLPPIPLMETHMISLGRGFPEFQVKLNFLVLGFAFFTHLDVLLSLWFFCLSGMVLEGLFTRLGFTIGESDIWGSSGGAALEWQAMGAFSAFALMSLWAARGHLRRVLSRVLGRGPTEDSDEPVPYRTALVGGGLAMIYMLLWLIRSGMSVEVAGVYLFALGVMTLGVTRFVAEAGLAYARMPITPQSFTFYTVGIDRMSPSSPAALALSYTTFGLGNTFGASALANIARIGMEVRLASRALFGTMAGFLLLALGVSTAYTLYLGYTHGACNFNVYTFNAGNVVVYDNVVQKLQNPFGPSPWRLLFFGIGASATMLCGVMRHRFLWWPLNPIGLAMHTAALVRWQVFSVMVAWVAKFALLRVGGIRIYRRSQPLFLGMMLGYVAGVGLVFVVDVIYFFGQGHVVHLW